ncbi:hypothetical protein AB833_25255 [Chromatiales bacterium (ex Bugula neritina AB1)]|nr:hypothetical protein AB833_25255 [Chromatiales bacterium (ex Bugula neritina AB1)]
MTPVQMQFVVRLIHQIKQSMEKCEETGQEVTEVVGHKRLNSETRITLTIVADPDAGFPAPLQSHGVGFESNPSTADSTRSAATPGIRRNQHGRGGRGPFG